MLFNDLIGLLSQIPTRMAVMWGLWFATGLLLSLWARRERMRIHVVDEHDGWPRPKSEERPPARAHSHAHAAVKSVPHSAGDAFGELEALLEPQEGTHRTPGEAPAPAAPSMHEPLRAAPVLAAPQSLP